MNYYGLVDEIYVENYGLYGRGEFIEILQENGINEKNFDKIKEDILKEDQKVAKKNIFAGLGAGAAIGLVGGLLSGPVGWITILAGLTATTIVNVRRGGFFQSASPIIKLSENEEADIKCIWIPNRALADNYNVENEGILYGLFKTNKHFETAMKADGGNSHLYIIERNCLPKSIKHWGGKGGKFDKGLYCEHPKDDSILLPLENMPEKVKTAILEETIRLYKNLGAKEITIEDIKEISVQNDTGVNSKADIKANVDIKKETLRYKRYAIDECCFDQDLAFKNLYFVRDYDEIMSVADARINGNQLIEEYTVNVKINIGLDVDILDLFNNKAKFDYTQKWHFKAEFFDKKDLLR